MQFSLRTAVSCAVLALGASACMVFSGVDELEVRKDPVETADSSAPNEPTPPIGLPNSKDAGTTDSGWKSARSGATVCGAQGTWSACSPLTVYASCSAYCTAMGKGCVDNCCATDQYGDYAATVGMYYAFATTCAVDAVPASSSIGYCTDPIMPFGYDVRCCCR